MGDRLRIPRDCHNDYTREAAAIRRNFVKTQTGVNLPHVPQYSFDPDTTPGNIEHFIGLAQVPVGLAGPLRIRGHYAQGDFWVPLATTDGTLVASCNRGIRVGSECGGAKTTVVEQFMNTRRFLSLPMLGKP